MYREFCTNGLTTPKEKIVLCTWNIKGKDLTTAVKPVWDLVCENVSTQSLNLNQLNWQMIKKHLHFSPAETNQEKLEDNENLRNNPFTRLE